MSKQVVIPVEYISQDFSEKRSKKINEKSEFMTADEVRSLVGVNSFNISDSFFPDILSGLVTPGKMYMDLYNGTIWIGADPSNGIFNGLPEGYPWPIKGYREDIIRCYADATGFKVDSVKYIDNLGLRTSTGRTVTFNGLNSTYTITKTGINYGRKLIAEVINNNTGKLINVDAVYSYTSVPGATYVFNGEIIITLTAINSSGAATPFVNGDEFFLRVMLFPQFAPPPDIPIGY